MPHVTTLMVPSRVHVKMDSKEVAKYVQVCLPFFFHFIVEIIRPEGPTSWVRFLIRFLILIFLLLFVVNFPYENYNTRAQCMTLTLISYRVYVFRLGAFSPIDFKTRFDMHNDVIYEIKWPLNWSNCHQHFITLLWLYAIKNIWKWTQYTQAWSIHISNIF